MIHVHEHVEKMSQYPQQEHYAFHGKLVFPVNEEDMPHRGITAGYPEFEIVKGLESLRNLSVALAAKYDSSVLDMKLIFPFEELHLHQGISLLLDAT
jgi:hypothetical protein